MPGNPYHHPRWKRTRLQILRRDNHVCQIRSPICTGTATQVDHITPLALGGPLLDPANLRASCQPCNSARLHLITDPTPSNEPPSRDW